MYVCERAHTIICSYSVWTGAMNRSPTPTECTLLLFMYNQCLFHEHVIFTHVHQRLHHVHPLWCVIAFIQFGVKRARWIGPYAYGMYAAIVYAQPMFIPRIYDICPRTPNCDTGCNYTIRCRRARWIGPYAYGMYAADCSRTPMFIPRTRNIYPRTPTFTPRAPTVGSRFIVPAYYGMYAAIVYAQSMFIPRIYDICPRTPIVIRGCNLHNSVWTFLCFICFAFHLCHSICALMIFLF